MSVAAYKDLTELEITIAITAGLVFIAVLALIIVFGVRITIKGKRERKQLLADRGSKMMVTLRHVNGLPVANGSQCHLFLSDHKVTIENGRSVFGIGMEQISVADFKMDVKISQTIKSNAHNGIISKKKRTITGYLIINYINANGKLASLVFCDIVPGSKEAAKFVDNLRPLIANNPKKSYQL